MSFKAMSFLEFKDDLLIREIDYLCYWNVAGDADQFFNEDGSWRVEAV